MNPKSSLSVWLPALLVLFVISYFAARFGLERLEPGSRSALALALVPCVAFACAILGYVRLVQRLDELERRIQLEGLAFAFPTAMLAVFSAGLLHLAGFGGEANWDLPRMWPLLLVPYAFGVALARRRYSG